MKLFPILKYLILFVLVLLTSAAAIVIMEDALALALSQYRGFITEIRVQDLMHIGDRIH